MRKALLALAICAAACSVAHAQEWVVEAHYHDIASLQRAAARFEHIILDSKRSVFRVNTNERGISKLQADGLDVQIDTAASAKLQAFNARLADAASRGFGLDSIPGFQCFRTVEETYQSMDDMVANHPNIVAIDDIGPTWKKTQDSSQGYEMRALHITNFATLPADPDRPRMAVYSSIHAREYSPAELDTRFAEWLVNNYGSDPEATWLIDRNDFHLILQGNPDARKLAEQQIYQRKNMDIINGPCAFEDETEQPGIDLNRNFPWHWGILPFDGGSSSDTCGQTYRGLGTYNNTTHIQGPLEPEAQNLFGYVAGTCDSGGNCSGGLFADHRAGPTDPPTPGDDGGDVAPDDTTGIFIDIHSNAALVLWPWGDTTNPAPNRTQLQTLGRRMAYFNGYTPEQSDQLYPTDGTTDDNMYGLLGVAAFTIETDGFDFFEDCPTFESDTSPRNIQALTYAARTLHAPYLLASGPDALNVATAPDLIAAGAPITVTATIDDTHVSGGEPTQNITAAAAYIDQLPWDSGAVATPLAAADGSFNSKTEAVVGTLDSTGLTTGRHLVYVQGTDANTDPTLRNGPPGAAFVDVAQANEIGTLQGTITARTGGAPIVAQVTVSDTATGETRSTQSAADGSYSRTMFAGTVDAHVEAPGYIAADATGLVLPGGGVLTQDFQMFSSCTVLFDDVENGNQYWTAQAPWVIVNNVPGNTTHVWDTPNYNNNINSSLTSLALTVAGYSDFTLDFDDRCDTESGFDFGNAEFSINNSATWTSLYSCSGQTTWQSHHIDLPASANGAATIKLRFRLQSDGGVTTTRGWAIDNIRLDAGGNACLAPQDRIFADGFD